MSVEEKFLVIFDMNGVLMSKNMQLNRNFSETPIKTQSKTVSIIHPNIDLNLLSQFYSTHKFKMGIWTTVMFKNAESPFKILSEIIGNELDCFLTQEDCSEGEMNENIKTKNCIKDLRKPAEILKIAIKNCILIDDSKGKRCEDQNFILFDPEKRDMLRVIETIDKFIGCKNKTCLAKSLSNCN